LKRLIGKRKKPDIASRMKATLGPTKTNSPLHKKHEPYFVQSVAVSTEFEGMRREEIFTKLLRGKKVLHVGYADWPITNVAANLHVQLDKVCDKIDGLDPHDEADSTLGPHVRGKFFRNWGEVKGRYDVVLAPEVMEHVDNVKEFLEQLDHAPAKQVIITVPDVSQCRNGHFDFVKKTGTVIEVVHPDHNYWFSPYTLANLIRKYTDWTIKGLWLINGISVMVIADKS
jgi:Methyltransferase domain